MANSVTVFNAERMQAIEDGSIVDGEINGSGHLILTKHNGDTVDAGDALVAVPDQSLVHILDATSYNSTTPPISYPDGVSLMYINASEATADWTTFAGKWGSIVTVNYPSGISADADTTQSWTRLHGTGTTPEQWIRSGNDGGGWSEWKRIMISDDIDALSTNHLIGAKPQSDLASTYDRGVTIFDVYSGSDWTPNSGSGTVVTARLNNDRNVQHFYSNFGGTQVPKAWMRTSHSSNGGGGWTGWSRVASPEDASTMGITGEIRMWSTGTAPTGWSFCDGTTLVRLTETALFAVIGTTYGVGNGTTTFNKPNFNGRVPVGFDSTQTEFDAMGETGGEKTHVLTSTEMPSHTHIQNSHIHSFGGNGALTDGSTGVNYALPSGSFYGFRATSTNATTPTNQNTGGDGAHNNLQPYITVRYIIKL